MKNSVVNDISNVVNNYLEVFYSQNNNNFRENIYSGVEQLLNGNYPKYNIKKIDEFECKNNDVVDFQEKLSKINEITENRKQRGVYYTPKDVTNYIIVNTFINYIYPDNIKIYDYYLGCEHLANQKDDLKNLIFNKIIFDPTCGAGEFLLNAFRIKIDLLLKIQNSISEDECIDVLKTIKGNDIESESTDVSKIRLFIEILKYISGEKIKNVVRVLNRNFYDEDFVMIAEKKIVKSDIVIGNPPYVEYSKLDNKPNNKYGNIYADVLQNSILSLKRKGIFGLIVPLSYVSTSRMQKIRNFVEENTCKQFILSYADRPDCLFTGVHQKLCIVFGMKSRANHYIFTSNYRHWYKSERKGLMNGCSIIENKFRHDGFIPKIGNEIENNIFRKIFTNAERNIYQLSNNTSGNELYLNMRATFYIKAFSFNPDSNEYKKFVFNDSYRNFILCLLNSSLYFLFWTIISDCWHITTKELKHMYVPNVEIDFAKFNKLSDKLEKKLENTKKYIGTVQTEYEYKHKECFDIINKIDSELSNIYKLTKEELLYVNSFALKYRMGKNVQMKEQAKRELKK